MKLIIAGSRDLNVNSIFGMLVNLRDTSPLLQQATEIVSGGATGVDTSALIFADAMNLDCTVFRALWHKYGKAAGPMRNQEMAQYADAAIVIMKKGGSRGSLNMISEMKKLNKPVEIYEV